MPELTFCIVFCMLWACERVFACGALISECPQLEKQVKELEERYQEAKRELRNVTHENKTIRDELKKANDKLNELGTFAAYLHALTHPHTPTVLHSFPYNY